MITEKKTFKEELFELEEELDDFRQDLIDHKFYPGEEKFYFKFFNSVNCELHVCKYNFSDMQSNNENNSEDIESIEIYFHLGNGIVQETMLFEECYNYDEFKKLDILKLIDKRLKFLQDMYIECHYALKERKK